MKISISRDGIARALRKVLALPRHGAKTEGTGVVALGAVAAIATALIVADQASALPADGVYRIADTVTTKDQFDRRVHVLGSVYGVKQPQARPALDRFNRDAAKAMAVTDILSDAARKGGVAVGDQEAEQNLDKVIQQTPGGRQEFIAQLGSLGLSERDVLAEIKRTILGMRMFDKITAKVAAPSEQEIERYYTDHKADMAVPESRKVRNIVVPDRQAADAVLRQLKGGADFADLASRQSSDQSTKDTGGDLGYVSADKFEPDYAKAAFAVSRNQFFGPVKTRFGWNVGQVLAITPAKPRTLEQVRGRLGSEMQLADKFDAWRSWLARQIKSADVQYADAYRPADPASPPADLSLR